MTTVITYGTFDLLHDGHVRLLRRARDMGDKLLVGLSTDEFTERKGKKCFFPYARRKEMLEELRCVDGVFAETCWEQKRSDVRLYGADIFVMGDDWQGKFDFLQAYCSVVYLPRTEGISTSLIKSSVLQ